MRANVGLTVGHRVLEGGRHGCVSDASDCFQLLSSSALSDTKPRKIRSLAVNPGSLSPNSRSQLRCNSGRLSSAQLSGNTSTVKH